MLGCKPSDTLIIQNHHLGIYHDQVPTNKERDEKLVKKLIYLSLTCRDITYAVSVVNQFMHSPNIMRILGYLKSARPRKGLMFKKHGTWVLRVLLMLTGPEKNYSSML